MVSGRDELGREIGAFVSVLSIPGVLEKLFSVVGEPCPCSLVLVFEGDIRGGSIAAGGGVCSVVGVLLDGVALPDRGVPVLA